MKKHTFLQSILFTAFVSLLLLTDVSLAASLTVNLEKIDTVVKSKEGRIFVFALFNSEDAGIGGNGILHFDGLEWYLLPPPQPSNVGFYKFSDPRTESGYWYWTADKVKRIVTIACNSAEDKYIEVTSQDLDDMKSILISKKIVLNINSERKISFATKDLNGIYYLMDVGKYDYRLPKRLYVGRKG